LSKTRVAFSDNLLKKNIHLQEALSLCITGQNGNISKQTEFLNCHESFGYKRGQMSNETAPIKPVKVFG
jgi:hypothetical protein